MTVANTLRRAAAELGSMAALARAIGVKPPSAQAWLMPEDDPDHRPVPPLRARQIADLTSVKVWELRPNDWHMYWPEQRRAKGAPKVEKV